MKSILCVGDSHASFFSGKDIIQPEYPERSINNIPHLEGVRLGAVLAYSLHKDNTTSQGREKLYDILSKTDRHQYAIMFCFGEIDCRFHLLRQAALQGLEIGIVVENCVNKYFEVIKDVSEAGFEVLVWNIIPTAYKGDNAEYPHYGTLLERNACTRLFNRLLKKKCAENSIFFIDIFDKLVGSRSKTREYYFFDGVHLGQLAMPYFIKKISAFYPHIKVSEGQFNWKRKILAARINHAKKKFKTMIKDTLKKSFVGKVWTMIQARKSKNAAKNLPSYDEKRAIIRHYRDKYKVGNFIETGTFLGDTIDNLRNDFNQLYSIELSEELALKAQKRFEGSNKIRIIQGDSGIEIKQLLKGLTEPCLFWLDGHYSSEFFVGDEYIKTAKGEKETPIIEELEAILSHNVKGHVILIDDARLFTGRNGYPTVKRIQELLSKAKLKYEISLNRDIINILPSL